MKLQTLNEAMKFGRKEISLIDRQARNIMVGVEYEFHVDSAKASNKTEEEQQQQWQQAYEEALEDLRQSVRQLVVQQAKQDVMPKEWDQLGYTATTIQSTLSSIEYDLDHAELGDAFPFLKKYQHLSGAEVKELINNKTMHQGFGFEVRRFLAIVQETAERFRGLSYDVELLNNEFHDLVFKIIPEIFQEENNAATAFVNNLREVVETVPEVNEALKEVPASDGNVIASWDKLRQLDLDTIRAAIRKAVSLKIVDQSSFVIDVLGGELQEYFYSQKITNEELDQRFHREWNDRSEGLRMEASRQADELVQADNDDPVSTVALTYDESDPRIKELTTDPSVRHGVELITEPLPLPDALEFMQEMFAYIEKVGFTSNSTGMHVNMSIKGKPFTKRTFDPMKLVMLLDDSYIRRNDPVAGIIKYPVRTHVGRILKNMNGFELIALAMDVNDHGIDELPDIFANQIDVKEKYQSINFGHAFIPEIDERRIEFRYFGGERYETRFDEIRLDIYKAVYGVMAGFDKDFARREYIQSLTRFLNRQTRDVIGRGMSFYDLLNIIKTHPHLDIDDLTNKLVIFRSSAENKRNPLKPKPRLV